MAGPTTNAITAIVAAARFPQLGRRRNPEEESGVRFGVSPGSVGSGGEVARQAIRLQISQ